MAEELNKTALQLKEAAKQTAIALSDCQRERKNECFKNLAINITISVLIGLLTVWLMLPTPYLPLTGAQLETFKAGEALERFWPKLHTKQRQWLLDVGNGKANNSHKNLLAMEDSAPASTKTRNNANVSEHPESE